MALSECCQEVVSLYWAGLTEWPVGGCVSMPGSQHHPSADICCTRNAVELVFGCILILQFVSSSHCLAEQTGGSARLACINCLCLAHCLLLITLINFNSPRSQHHSSCFSDRHTHNYTDSFPHAYTDRHECAFVRTQPCICFTAWNSQQLLNWFLHLTAFLSFGSNLIILQLWLKTRGKQLRNNYIRASGKVCFYIHNVTDSSFWKFSFLYIISTGEDYMKKEWLKEKWRSESNKIVFVT